MTTRDRQRATSVAMFLCAAFAAAFAAASAGIAAAAAPARAPDAALVAALTLQADKWDKDIVRKDAAAIAANMAEDFRQIASDGSVADKAAFLRDITSPELTIDPYTVEDFDVRIYGKGSDVALLCGRTRMTGRYKGEPFTTHYRYIDTYVRRDGRWQVVSVHTTKVREAESN